MCKQTDHLVLLNALNEVPETCTSFSNQLMTTHLHLKQVIKMTENYLLDPLTLSVHNRLSLKYFLRLRRLTCRNEFSLDSCAMILIYAYYYERSMNYLHRLTGILILIYHQILSYSRDKSRRSKNNMKYLN